MDSNVPITGDMTYEFEIIDAGLHPAGLYALTHPAKDIKDGVPFYLLSAGADGKGSHYTVAAATEDKYKPHKTGVFNVFLGDYKGKLSDNKFQQWKFNWKDDTITSVAHPESGLLDGSNANLATYKNMGWKQQKFHYNLKTRELTAVHTGKLIGIENGKFFEGANIARVEPGVAHLWDIVYAA
jgi:hypothetical protein